MGRKDLAAELAMDTGPSQANSRDIDSLSIAQRFTGRPDPLGDVITWLDSVDLADELGDDLSRVWQETGASGLCGGDAPFGVRELFADTPQEGAAAPLGNPRTRCNDDPWDTPRAPGAAGAAGAAARPESGLQQQLGPPAQRASSRGPVRACCFSTWDLGGQVTDPRNFVLNDQSEEDEWDARQKQTGAAGRLVVYSEGDRPKDDLLLRGGGGRRVIVTAVAEDGKANKAGVKAGDVLVSINGKKDFVEQSADIIHASLTAPVMLVFMGFVGKLQAEVRLNYAEKVAGMSSQQQVVFGRPDAPVRVIDEVVFQPAAAPLFLTTTVPTQPVPVVATQQPPTPGLNRGPQAPGLSSAAPASGIALSPRSLEMSPGPQSTGLPSGPQEPALPSGPHAHSLPTGPNVMSAGLQTLMKPVTNTPLISLESLDLSGPVSDEHAAEVAQRILREDTGGYASGTSEPVPPRDGIDDPLPVCASPQARSAAGTTGKLAPAAMPVREQTEMSAALSTATSLTGNNDALQPGAVYELQVEEAKTLVQKALAKVRAKEKFDEQVNGSVGDIIQFAQAAPRTISSGSGSGAFGSRIMSEESPAKPSDALGVEAVAPPATAAPIFSNLQASLGDTFPVPVDPSRSEEAGPSQQSPALFVNHAGNQGDTSPAPLDHSRSDEATGLEDLNDGDLELDLSNGYLVV